VSNTIYASIIPRVNSRVVYAYGLRAGTIDVHDGRWVAYAADWSPLGSWSSEARAARSIENDLLRRLYPPAKGRAA
jgi:hypothetical protein